MSAEIRSTSDFEQPPTHYMQIGFDNFQDFQRTHREQERDPLNENFNWWYWCGLRNEEDMNEVIQQYQQTVQMIPEAFYQGNTALIEPLIANNTLSSFSGEIIKNTIEQLKRDVIDRNPDGRIGEDGAQQTPTPEVKRMLFRILFIIYSKEGENGRWFIQGEDKVLYQLYIGLTSLNRIPVLQIEPLLYFIWLNCIIKTPLKDMLWPCVRGSNQLMNMFSEANFTLYSTDKLTANKFFDWLISLLIIKKYKNNFTNLINAKKKQRDYFFSSLVQQVTMFINGPLCLLCSSRANNLYLLNIVKIFGNLLVSKDATQFIAYIASYWCSYVPDNELLDNVWDNLATSGTDGEPDFIQIAMMYTASLRRSNVYDNPIDENEFNRIYNYFKQLKKQGSLTSDTRLSSPVAAKQRTKFEDLVLLCINKSWKKGKQTPGSGAVQLYIFPTKYVKGNDIWNVIAEEPAEEEGELSRTNTQPPQQGQEEEEEEETQTEEQGEQGEQGEQTPYFGANKQTFFINQWAAWSEANIGDPLAVAYGEFTQLAAAIGGQRFGANSGTFVPFLYLVANQNGGNYNINQGNGPRGAVVDWQNNFNEQQLQELNNAADNFTQWANQHNPQLIRVLMQFLQDVNQNPDDIQLGGKRKRRKKYKTLKKSNRKLNKTIRLR